MPTPDFDDARFNDARFDDEREDRFGAYLKEFHPLAIDALPIETASRAIRGRFVFAGLEALAAAVILVAAVLAFHPHLPPTHSTAGLANGDPANGAKVEQLIGTQPLTIGSANALLARAASVQEALDHVPFHPPSTQLPKGKQSALTVLSEDNDKL